MKKIISLILVIVMMSSLCVVAYAENELAGAKKFSLGDSKSGDIYEDESVVYKFNMSKSGKLDIELYSDLSYISMKLFDKDGQRLWSNGIYDNDTTKEIRYLNSFVLCEGLYYITMENSSDSGEYELSLSESSIYETFSEEQNGSNNSTKTANVINHGNKYVGCLALNDETDVYRFNLNEAGRMSFDLYGELSYMNVQLYDNKGQRLWSNGIYDNDTTKEINFQKDFYLCKGEYYISMSASSSYGEYSFEFLFTSANESFSESQDSNNNTTASANIININQQYNGMLALNDNVDIYRIQLNEVNPTLNLNGNMPSVRAELYDENGSKLWSNTIYDNDTIKEIRYSNEIKSKTGLHFLSISGSNTGNYSFSLSDGGSVVETGGINSVIKVKLNGRYINFDQQPILENGRTLVPLRAIFEALGAKVYWDDSTQTVIATKDNIQITLQIGSTQMYVNGVAKTLDVPAKLINSRTLVPVRAISESFGCEVDWDGDTQTVIITQ